MILYGKCALEDSIAIKIYECISNNTLDLKNLTRNTGKIKNHLINYCEDFCIPMTEENRQMANFSYDVMDNSLTIFRGLSTDYSNKYFISVDGDIIIDKPSYITIKEWL